MRPSFSVKREAVSDECAAFRVAVIFSYRVLSVNGFDYFMESLMIL